MSNERRHVESYVGPEHVGEEILCIDGLSYSYPGGVTALEDIDLHVQRGATLGVIGPNGAGKSTLLKVVLGLLGDYRGQVKVDGLSPGEARRRGDILGWVPQYFGVQWDFPVSVQQVVRMGLVGKTGLFRRFGREDLHYADHIIEKLDLEGIRRKPVGTISGGQQQRTMIARALVARPRLLLLDEPPVGIDQPSVETFSALLADIRESFGVTLVIVSHDLRKMLHECERVACLNRRLHFHDVPSRLSGAQLGEVYRCELTGMFTSPDARYTPGGASEPAEGDRHGD